MPHLLRYALGVGLLAWVSIVHGGGPSAGAAAASAVADTGKDAAEVVFSPYVARTVPPRPLWGDSHLHTANSLDARAFGVTLSAEDAFRFARGEAVTATHGVPFKLSRPLDWLAVTDHSDGMGAMKEIIAGNPTLMEDPQLKTWNAGLNSDPDTILAATMEVIEAFTGIGDTPMPAAAMDPAFVGEHLAPSRGNRGRIQCPGSFHGDDWLRVDLHRER